MRAIKVRVNGVKSLWFVLLALAVLPLTLGQSCAPEPAPEVQPPVITPPIVEPPIATPPIVTPPVIDPPPVVEVPPLTPPQPEEPPVVEEPSDQLGEDEVDAGVPVEGTPDDEEIN